MPRWKKAVRCDTRAACCIEWVTMMMVKFCRSSSISSSMRGGRDRVERRTRLVHQDHLGADRDRTRNAKTLLLAAGKSGARIGQAVLHFLIQAGALQTRFHDGIEFGLVARKAVDARPIGDILVDRFRERIGLLEHHAHARAQLHDIQRLVVDVEVVELDLAGHARRRDGVVHPVDAAQECRLAAARRSDKRHHRLFGDVDVHVLQRVLVAVIDVDVPRDHLRPHVAEGWLGAAGIRGLYHGVHSKHLPLPIITSGARSVCEEELRCRSSRTERRAAP